jgi:hypothetical protein
MKLLSIPNGSLTPKVILLNEQFAASVGAKKSKAAFRRLKILTAPPAG